MIRVSQPRVHDASLKSIGPFTPRKRTDLLVLHHAAAKSCTVEDVHRWHLGNGWMGIGYHYFVSKLGEVFRGRPEGAVGAHAEGHNDRSIGICAEGDFDEEKAMTPLQRKALREMVAWIRSRYPGIAVKRHGDVNKTLCPGVNYPFAQIVAEACGTPILGDPRAAVAQAQTWSRSRGAAQVFVDLAPLYWQEGPTRGGVRPDVAYAQAAKETGFGRFGGVISGPESHNWCGLKTAQGGDNSDPNAHARFADDLTGVRAHLDHLALYAGATGYPRVGTPDPRHFAWIAGTAPTVEQLSGRWAGVGYGESVVKDYLSGLLATPEPEAPEKDPETDELRQEISLLKGQVLALMSERDALLERIEQARTVLTMKS